MNVIHLRHHQFKRNVAEFSDLREEASTRLSFTISSFFSKTLHRRGLYTLINLQYFKFFTGTSSLLKANQFPSSHASTSEAYYSPTQMHYLHPSKILRQRFRRRREKCFLVSGVLKFSMCQSKNY